TVGDFVQLYTVFGVAAVEKNPPSAVYSGVVYFAFRGSSVINHAGIYCGGGIFLHCSNAKYGVKLDKITDGTYKNAFAAGRRDIK
ncbi:MAG: C40 family peptidase, partial [Abditibacteriota bacterium]|nr:C40 family peptidase [Abditibacteriota bacterium]